MKTAEEILRTDSVLWNYLDPASRGIIIGFMKVYAKTVAEQTLSHVSTIALMKYHCGHFKVDTPTQYHQMGADNIQIDKDSILNTKIELP